MLDASGNRVSQVRTGATRVETPLGRGPADEPEPPELPPAKRMVRLEILLGMNWRLRPTEPTVLASIEYGRLEGFSGSIHGGIIVAPDRRAIAAEDFPTGAGFTYRRRLTKKRNLFGSVGASAGLLVHRASTDNGVVHRVDPDLMIPLRFMWSTGPLGLTVALVQGYSFRTRTYERRGIEVWSRIPYRIGITFGLHFDFGVGSARKRRADRRRSPPP